MNKCMKFHQESVGEKNCISYLILSFECFGFSDAYHVQIVRKQAIMKCIFRTNCKKILNKN